MNAINEGFVYKYFTPMNGEVQLVGKKNVYDYNSEFWNI